MWNQKKSVVLSIVCTRVLIVLTIALAVLDPFLAANGFFDDRALIRADMIPALLTVTYVCFVPAIILLFMLERLLVSIRRGDVFTRKNVNYLRLISWACFAAAIILLCSGFFISVVFLFMGVCAGFFGLILRVVKNVIAAAVQIKEENDFTI